MNTQFIRTALSLIIPVSLVVIMSCGSDPLPSATEVATKKMVAHTWNVVSVSVSGVDNTSLYDEFKITFNDTGFTTTNGGLVWPAQGSWSFTNESATAIVRDDEMIVTLTQLTEDALIMTLTWNKTTFGPGRNNSLAGVHVFTLAPM